MVVLVLHVRDLQPENGNGELSDMSRKRETQAVACIPSVFRNGCVRRLLWLLACSLGYRVSTGILGLQGLGLSLHPGEGSSFSGR